MIRAFFIIVFLCLWTFFSSAAETVPDYLLNKNETSVYKESLYQGWASLPQTEVRLFQSVAQVFCPESSSNFFNLTCFELLQLKAKDLQGYHALLYSEPPKVLGFTNIHQIFPFHQFW